MDFPKTWQVLTLLKAWAENSGNSYYYDEEKPKNGILARQTYTATNLKLGMHILFDYGNDMGWVLVATPLPVPV